MRLELKLLEENREKLHDIDCGNTLMATTSKVQTTEAKIDKWNYNKLKNFCSAKTTINRVKGQPTEWEKIFANLRKGVNLQDMYMLPQLKGKTLTT